MRGIDPITWRLVSPLLDRALETDVADRQAFLDVVRTDRPEIAALLELQQRVRQRRKSRLPGGVRTHWRWVLHPATTGTASS